MEEAHFWRVCEYSTCSN